MVNQENFRLCQEVNLRVVKRLLIFNVPARTSRDTIYHKFSWYLLLESDDRKICGIGECAPLSGLSVESVSQIESDLNLITSGKISFNVFEQLISTNSSLKFGIETACNDFRNGGLRIVFPGYESALIDINGLVWMSDVDTMMAEAERKIKEGFGTIKFKVGALKFDDELEMLTQVRLNFPQIVLRLDANGAFADHDVMSKLDKLSKLEIHSIEQPVHPSNIELIKSVVKDSPIPVALDEQLLGVHNIHLKYELLNEIKPNYIILKPTLHGGLSGCDEWIQIAENVGIGWWTTSALESNIGLNAIAQWTATKQLRLPQGLGTGGLFENNLPSPLFIHEGKLGWNKKSEWNLNSILE